ncbi:hypothetical protein GQ43DRAFT_429119 [Delitschia confertaspora ATCC 74209]|uniref:RING-type domain-containing protein n=1 Tax=Delitschia confertaspora ATCC 74209 TaxID=1513339 RepID=A0A9P4JVP8_9PLEO|nr:hypothetical protein GQ43DRAFT_429119 [Delitschia confertaspora ATCC 74209]
MADGEKHGMADLEKELTCSICTDLLYQPLTLLDCLHTFCGACLKEWFQFQASTAMSLHPYTCPSCRTSVRGTKPNATVTTLLDIFLQAHPGRGKSAEEKKSDEEKYKPGDNVLPKLRKREGAEEDQRLIEEVQQMSLREIGIPSASLEPPREHRRREHRRRERSREHSRETRNGHRARRSRSRNSETPTSRREDMPPRHVEHQSSLRSLLSASELDPEIMGEEIMRQIMEEGLLDDIDLDNIDVGQEDEISERIAQAYRRRQREKRRERQERRERLAREGRGETHVRSPSVSTNEVRNVSRPSATQEEDQPRRRPHGRSESGSGTSTPQPQSSSRPPISRPALIEAANQGPRARHTRSSSQGSSRSITRPNRPDSLMVSSTRQAARSANELTDRPLTSSSNSASRRRMSENQQSSATEERQQFRNNLNARPSSNPNTPRGSSFTVNRESPSSSTTAIVSPPATAPPSTHRRVTDPTHTRQIRPLNDNSSIVTSPVTGVPRSTTNSTDAASTASTPTTSGATLYPEPAISCNRCGKGHIEYDLHYNCSRCEQGDYNLCLSCYRNGKGCNHWFGFGWAAWTKYERMAPPGGWPPSSEYPHILTGHRYQRPTKGTAEPSTFTKQRIMTEEDPTRRLESGVFCEICLACANACYWKCDICNEGAWGFCNECVNQGRHCTHALLPIASSKPTQDNGAPASASLAPRPSTGSRTASVSESSSTPPLTPKSASLIRGPGMVTLANRLFRPLTFTTECNVCRYPIPPSHTRFHCLQCNKGDYDICQSCYPKLVSTGRISVENGKFGWRRCLRGHRVVVVGFEDRDGGQRRVVTQDLVGGLAFRDDEDEQTHHGAQSVHAPISTTSPPGSSLWSWRDSDGSIHRSTISNSHSSIARLNPGTHAFSAPEINSRFPPEGVIGLRVVALWSYFPAEGVTDELMFPKNAELREVEDINGDWYIGSYAGRRALFPGNYGRVVW